MSGASALVSWSIAVSGGNARGSCRSCSALLPDIEHTIRQQLQVVHLGDRDRNMRVGHSGFFYKFGGSFAIEVAIRTFSSGRH